MNFRKEVIPIDGSNFGSLTGDFAFWAVALLGVMPLMIITLRINMSNSRCLPFSSPRCGV